MYFKEYIPDVFFAKFIDSYFTVDSSLIREDITDLIVPDGTFGLLFINGQDGIGRNCAAQTTPITLKKTSLFGQKTKPVKYYYTPGTVKSFGIKINPAGLPLFFDDSLREYKNVYVEIDELENRDLKELEVRVLEAKTIELKIEVVEEYLLTRLSKIQSNENYLLFCSVVEVIKAKRGDIRFDSLTQIMNVNYKKIERLFHFYLGVTPKTYIRIVRFNSTIYLHHQNEHYNLTQLGHEVGFFDQSHFIREFKSFSSLTPKDFFEKELTVSEKSNQKVTLARWKN